MNDESMFMNQDAMRKLLNEIRDPATRLLMSAAISRIMGYWVRSENVARLLANPVDVYAIAKALQPLLSDHETLKRILSGEYSTFDDLPE
jgi:hypothetical protein